MAFKESSLQTGEVFRNRIKDLLKLCKILLIQDILTASLGTAYDGISSLTFRIYVLATPILFLALFCFSAQAQTLVEYDIRNISAGGWTFQSAGIAPNTPPANVNASNLTVDPEGIIKRETFYEQFSSHMLVSGWSDTFNANNCYNLDISSDPGFVLNLSQFTPGQGFWVLSKYVLEVNTSIQGVSVHEGDAYSIELNPGWNIISNPHQQPGWHVVQFDGRNLASGVYFYRIAGDNMLQVKQMTLIK